jgi:hypothetical protein
VGINIKQHIPTGVGGDTSFLDVVSYITTSKIGERCESVKGKKSRKGEKN